MSNDNHYEQKQKLLQLVKEAVRQDGELRATHQVGDKFRFIRDRLNALSTHLEEHLSELTKKKEKKQDILSENEMLVYVYLFNAQGIVLQTWQKMLNPSVFYDHSVNRPIYIDKAHIEAFIRSKTNRVQHGYLTIAMSKEAVIKSSASELLKDALGHQLIKIKEGSLQFKRLIEFTHNGHTYFVGEAGTLTKK